MDGMTLELETFGASSPVTAHHSYPPPEIRATHVDNCHLLSILTTFDIMYLLLASLSDISLTTYYDLMYCLKHAVASDVCTIMSKIVIPLSRNDSTK
jgi:hypothetical protein